MRSRVLLLGGTGFLGSEIFLSLKEKYDVLLASEEKGSKFLSSDILERYWTFCDIKDMKSMEDLVTTGSFDYIFLLAAKIEVLQGAPFETGSELFACTFKGILDLLKVVAQNKPETRMIFSSSMTVYAAGNTSPVKEDGALKPIHPYGWYKKWTEEALAYYAEYFGFKFLVLRFPGLFGTKRKDGYIHTISGAIKEGRDVNLNGGKLGFWETMDVKDAAGAAVAAMEGYDWDGPGDIFNIGYGEETDYIDTAYLIKDLLKSDSKINVPEDLSYKKFYMSDKKYKEFFGSQAGTFKDALNDYLGGSR